MSSFTLQEIEYKLLTGELSTDFVDKNKHKFIVSGITLEEYIDLYKITDNIRAVGGKYLRVNRNIPIDYTWLMSADFVEGNIQVGDFYLTPVDGQIVKTVITKIDKKLPSFDYSTKNGIEGEVIGKEDIENLAGIIITESRAYIRKGL